MKLTHVSIGMAFALCAAGFVASAPSAGASAGGASGSVSARSSAKAPDPFYAPPKGFGHKAPGTILRARQVHPTLFSMASKNAAWQLLYRSTDQYGKPMAIVTTVVAPVGKATGILSYQIATDSSAPRCAPSHEVTDYQDLPSSVLLAAESSSISDALKSGLAVSLPDYEGPRAEFAAPRQPGYAVLDGIRAAEHFSAMHLSTSTPAVIWGYSGGSLASGWAAQLKRTYAPELHVAGVAVGGFVSSVQPNMLHLNKSLFGGFIPAVFPGIFRQSPRLAAAFHAVMKPGGRRALALGAKQCSVEDLGVFAGFDLGHYLKVPLRQLVKKPAVARGFAAMNLGGSTPQMPMFVYHAVHDELIGIRSSDAIVPEYCAHGARITYVRSATAEHITLQGIASPAILAWFTARVKGVPVPAGCTTTTVQSMANYR
ncbi:MAG: hypothetical protein JWP74_873 [Marmoricola sp.]|nr:hypothetical protein [Marmoricola sp.]